jgi:hypothetical protein
MTAIYWLTLTWSPKNAAICHLLSFLEPFLLCAISVGINAQEIGMSEASPLRHIFKAYANKLPDGTFSSHVSHSVEGRPDIAERIHDVCIVGTEQEALDEAHAFVAKYVAEHSEYSE